MIVVFVPILVDVVPRPLFIDLNDSPMFGTAGVIWFTKITIAIQGPFLKVATLYRVRKK